MYRVHRRDMSMGSGSGSGPSQLPLQIVTSKCPLVSLLFLHIGCIRMSTILFDTPFITFPVFFVCFSHVRTKRKHTCIYYPKALHTNRTNSTRVRTELTNTFDVRSSKFDKQVNILHVVCAARPKGPPRRPAYAA